MPANIRIWSCKRSLLCLVVGYELLQTCPDGDLIPCDAGDGVIEMADVLAALDAFAGIETCPSPCPP